MVETRNQSPSIPMRCPATIDVDRPPPSNQANLDAIEAAPPSSLTLPPTLRLHQPNHLSLPNPPSKKTSFRLRNPKLFAKKILDWLKGKLHHRLYYEETWQRHIVLEAPQAPDPHHCAVAIIDTGSYDDFISLELALLLQTGINDALGEDEAPETIIGEPVQVRGRVNVRWHCDQSSVPSKHKRNFPDKFESGTFRVVDTQKFDVIIGKETINRFKLLDPPKRNLFGLIRGAQPKEDDKAIAAARKEANERRRREEEDMEQEDAEKDKRKAESKGKPKS